MTITNLMKIILNNFFKNQKMIALDVGSQGGFNSDNFFLTDTINFFKQILVDPIKNSDKDEEDKIYINKGLWSSKIKKTIHFR